MTVRRARHAPIRLGLAVLSLLFLIGCEDQGIVRGALVLEGDHVLGPGTGHVLVLGGAARVPEDSAVSGTVVLLGGELTVRGRIDGDLMLLDGRAVLGPTAVVEGTLVTAGAEVERSPGSTVRGGVRTDLDVLGELARPAPTFGERIVTWLLQALALGAFAWLVALMASRPVARIADAAARHAVVSVALGALAALVATVLLVVMAFTVVLIPVTLVVALVLLVAVALGWVAWGEALAAAVVRARGGERVRPRHVAIATPLVAGALGLVSAIPFIGSIVALAVTVGGFGAVLVTGFGSRRFVPEGARAAKDGARDASGGR